MARPDIKCLYYITHIGNVASILQRGILAHSVVQREGVPFTPIYDNSIVENRRSKQTPNGKSLWDYANVYFQPRNPMMYRVVHEKSKDNLAVLAVRPTVIELGGIVISDGNAANGPTRFYDSASGLKMLSEQWEVITSEWWRPDDGSKRRIMSECLVPERIPPEFIDSVFVASQDVAEQLKPNINTGRVHIIAEPNMFFLPQRASQIGGNISLINGDMFFSNMQTLTVSVNVKGIMGKGLASRAKYQFPDVYVEYQDACRSRQLTPTKPYLYKRERSMDEELADLTSPLNTPNAIKWFLLFATKRHWRDDSRYDDIDAGLNWLLDNYSTAGIRSIAMPALGCGLGGLDWKDIGPLMCRYLHKMNIPAAIYLPREGKIPEQYLKKEFLLEP